MSTAVATEFPARMYIDGAWCDAKDGKTLAIINPADESVLAEIAYGGGQTQSGRSRRPRGPFPTGVRRRSTIAPRS